MEYDFIYIVFTWDLSSLDEIKKCIILILVCRGYISFIWKRHRFRQYKCQIFKGFTKTEVPVEFELFEFRIGILTQYYKLSLKSTLIYRNSWRVPNQIKITYHWQTSSLMWENMKKTWGFTFLIWIATVMVSSHWSFNR